jgi:hypothetical protein
MVQAPVPQPVEALLGAPAAVLSDLSDSNDLRHNQDVAWDGFNTNVYWHHNYKRLRDDDRFILRKVGQFFAAHFTSLPQCKVESGIDVGTGGNLYPALAMLPWCERIILTDHSQANLEWIERQCQNIEPSWEEFWSELARIDGYPSAEEFSPFAELARPERVSVEWMNVFHLPVSSYDVGTMFFVAESMTNFQDEFKRATASFLRCLRPGAPFAAAFMDSSQGYEVGAECYPAVRAVTVGEVRATLVELGASIDVEKVPIPAEDPLREGYEGMIIAVGTTPA